MRFVILFIAAALCCVVTPASAKSEALHWIAVGGGATPSMNQVSLEEDLRLVARTLSGQGYVLFAGGKGGQGVQVERRTGRSRDLVQVLGDIFSPRPGRQALYRGTRLRVDGPASGEKVNAVLAQALSSGDDDLLFFASAHGEVGQTRRANYLALWGNEAFDVGELTRHLDDAGSSRHVRVVISACFSGGFAEMVFHAAEPTLGLGRRNRCGLFAATWDEVSSGCDPDPVRQHHEGYANHFFNALAGRTRDGKVVDRSELDVDGTPGISLLEAHSFVRNVSTAVDVPTTTSERWLRFMVPSEGAVEPVFLPEEENVVRQLLKRLDLEGRAHGARERLAVLEYALSRAEENVTNAQELEFEAYRMLAAELLNRWPVLDDPWHPDYPKLLASEGRKISAYLSASPRYLAFHGALKEHDAASAELDDIMRERAPYARLVRALNTLSWAGQLKALGGLAWERYDELLKCERWTPSIGTLDEGEPGTAPP